MKYEKINLVYFSPTGNTKKAVRTVAQGIGSDFSEHDLTVFENRWKKYSFNENDLVIIGMPVYGGRIPEISAEIFRCLEASNTPVVLILTYGNRDYDDALLELKNECEKVGFISIAAGVIVGEHSFSHDLATDRPDSEDVKEMLDFGRRITTRLANIDLSSFDLEVPGNYPYQHFSSLPIAPTTNDNCNECGMCAKNCPMRAINIGKVSEIDFFRCINCFKCIKECPQKAKEIKIEAFNEKVSLLVAMCSQKRQKSTFF